MKPIFYIISEFVGQKTLLSISTSRAQAEQIAAAAQARGNTTAITFGAWR